MLTSMLPYYSSNVSTRRLYGETIVLEHGILLLTTSTAIFGISPIP